MARGLLSSRAAERKAEDDERVQLNTASKERMLEAAIRVQVGCGRAWAWLPTTAPVGGLGVGSRRGRPRTLRT